MPGKKENAKDLTPNLSLFKNKRFSPKVKSKKLIQCPCIPNRSLHCRIPPPLSDLLWGRGRKRGRVRDQRAYCPHPGCSAHRQASNL